MPAPVDPPTALDRRVEAVAAGAASAVTALERAHAEPWDGVERRATARPEGVPISAEMVAAIAAAASQHALVTSLVSAAAAARHA